MYKLLGFILCCLLLITNSSAQGGLAIYGGGTTQIVGGDVITSDGPQVGWHLGGDIRLNSGGMYFVLGGRYTSMNFTTNSAIYTGASPKMNQFKTRIGLGFTLVKISDRLKIRGKFLGSIDYLMDTPLRESETNPDFIDYRRVNSTGSLIGGLGLTVGPFLVDLEYGYGLFNLITEMPETKTTTVSLSVGILL